MVWLSLCIYIFFLRADWSCYHLNCQIISFKCLYVMFASSTAALLCSLAVSPFQQESVAVLWYDYGASKNTKTTKTLSFFCSLYTKYKQLSINTFTYHQLTHAIYRILLNYLYFYRIFLRLVYHWTWPGFHHNIFKPLVH